MHLKTPVLFLIYNRPDITRKVFNAIRLAAPSRLFIAADGPRYDSTGDRDKCEQTRRIVDFVDWDCEVVKLFRENNLGCKKAVSSAIDWFFQNVEKGIILEDDCLPNPDFFQFCSSLLDRYEDEERVWVITGDNFQSGQVRGNASYYFSKYNHCWGWATWRRAWKHYCVDLPFWPEWKNSNDWLLKTPDLVERRYWMNLFEMAAQDEINSWAYPWIACAWYHRGLTATPNVNLVTNIGFGPDATHTLMDETKEGLPVYSLGPITHPDKIEQDQEADCYVFDNIFGGRSNQLDWKSILNATKNSALRVFNLILSKPDPIEDLIKTVTPYTFCSEDKLRSLVQQCNYLNSIGVNGDYVECGTYKGGTAAVLSFSLGKTRKLWLYDSFEGMPETTEHDGETAKQYIGEGAVDIKDVFNVLNLVCADMSRVIVVKGLFEETFRNHIPKQVALLHCDADWYGSVLLTLRTFYDRVVDGGVIILDDFGYWEGAREAFYDFVNERGIKPLLERVGSDQLYWVKGKTSNRKT